MREIYCDSSATTPVHPIVIREMERFFKRQWGNPSSIYTRGRVAKSEVLDARVRVANILNCKPNEVYFTSGGSESDNIFIKGCFKENSAIITSSIEHPAVLNSCKSLKMLGALQITLQVGKNGIIDIDFLKGISNLIKKEKPIYATLMLVNNETGVIQPIAKIAQYLRSLVPNIIIHTDAVQAVGSVSLDVQELGVDSMSLSGHKFGAPKGIGILYLKEGIKCKPLIDGGGQEMGLRGGTENVPYIMGITKALEIAQSHYKDLDFQHKFRAFDIDFCKRIINEIPEAHLNTSGEGEISGVLNFRFDGIDAQSLLLYLDAHNICVSAGSACHSDKNTPSHILKAMGLTDEEALSSLRFSFKKPLPKSDIDYIITTLKEGIKSQQKYRL